MNVLFMSSPRESNGFPSLWSGCGSRGLTDPAAKLVVMTEPRVPGTDAGTDADAFELPCGEAVTAGEFDLGMREYECVCGGTHAVVMDMHPPSRWLPESIVDVLQACVKPSEEDEWDEFQTPHIMGAVMEDIPGDVVAHDASGNPDVGYAVLWVADMDARALHEVIVELVVELMDHAVSHAEDEDMAGEFEAQMLDFDVSAFVDEYRAQRDFEDEYDAAL